MEEASLSDGSQLAALGYTPELPRQLSRLSLLGMAFVILNTWSVLAATLKLSLSSGGPCVAIWGLLVVGFCNICLAASLAEFLSAYPTAGGQYHWVAVIAPKRYAAILAWATGWLTVFGWIAVAASAAVMVSHLVLGLLYSGVEHQMPSRWEELALYLCAAFVGFAGNYWFGQVLRHFNQAALIWSLLGFVAVPTFGYVFSSRPLADPAFVFTYVINKTGWPDGVAWSLGLLQAAVALNGYDAVAHMIEEIPNASFEGPRIMIGSVVLGVIVGFAFLTALLFLAGGPEGMDFIIQSPAGPLMALLEYATANRALASSLVMIPIIGGVFGTTSIMTTSSRMVFAFARDGGFSDGSVYAHVDPDLGMPLNALYLTTAITMLFGLLFLVSTTAFNAVCAASVVGLSLSYALPLAIHCLQGRQKLPPRRFELPRTIGWMANVVGIAYAIVTAVLFLLPPKLPVTGATMNYGAVALVFMLSLSALSWVLYGKERYRGPALVGYERVETDEE